MARAPSTGGAVALPMRFEKAAKVSLADTQLRRNLGKATSTIREKRAAVVRELPDWEALRDAGEAIKRRVMANLDGYLVQLEAAVRAAGGEVHWARDAAEANAHVVRLVRAHGAREVIKVKSMATDEIGLNRALAGELDDELGQVGLNGLDAGPGEPSSHILVPAIHKNRAEIRELFMRTLGLAELSDEPAALAGAARAYLREKFLTVPVGVSGANFAVAETGTVGVVESEGNGRMCVTLPEVLITVMGIEKLLPTWRDLEVFLQLLPRSSTGERMNPYTSFWTGVTPGDGPQAFHLVLLDNGRTQVLADAVGRSALHCIRCSACLNVCPVYERAGGHAYGSVYPGPIGAILTPQLRGLENAPSLPYASSLCGACFEVCPVKINIPEVLVHLRARVVDAQRERPSAERLAMAAAARVFASPARYERAQRLARLAQWPFARRGLVSSLPPPLSGWSAVRDLRAVPPQTFREWWRARGAA